MPTPYKEQVANKLWTLLEAHAPFTALILAGNRHKQKTDGWLRELIKTAPNDYPKVAINNGRFTHSGYTLGQTFADEQALTYSDAIHGGMAIRRRAEFVMTITGRDAKSGSVDAIEEAAQNALLLGGPRLGFSWVLQTGPIDAVQETIEDGGAHVQSRLTIPVLMEFLARDLLA